MIPSDHQTSSLRQAVFSLLFLISFLGVGNAQTSTTRRVQQWSSTQLLQVGPSGDFATIQQAIGVCNDGDTILVLESWVSEDWSNQNFSSPIPPGFALTTYQEDIVYPHSSSTPKNITIKSAPVYSDQGKVIEIKGTGTSSVVTFSSNDIGRLSVLEGFIISGGLGTDHPNELGAKVGGGIYCENSTPTIHNCIIRDNTSVAGAGIYMYFSPLTTRLPATEGPLLEGCRLENNHAVGGGSLIMGNGGGLVANHCSPEVIDCIFEGNTALQKGGGAMFHNASDPEFKPTTRPIVKGVSFVENYTYGSGGGIAAIHYASVQITESLFLSNTASESGGGLYWDLCSVNLSTSYIHGNIAESNGATFYGGGGGIAVDAGGDEFLNARIEHCTIARNRAGSTLGGGSGGGLLLRDGKSEGYNAGLFVENCLIVRNNAGGQGGGVAVIGSASTLINCTVSDNKVLGAGVAGGVYFYYAQNPEAWIALRDSIISDNVEGPGASVTNPWDRDFYDGSPLFPTPSYTVPLLTYCLMPLAGGWTSFVNPIKYNLVASPFFASGPTSTFFPKGQYYLSHSSQQGITSQAYDNGSGPIHSGLAVYEMTCRTAVTFYDIGTVDMGFHYPKTELIPFP